MAGAEGKSCFNLDAYVIWRDPSAVVRAVNQKPPGADRGQSRQGAGDPIALRGSAKFDISRGALARRQDYEIA